MTYQALWWHKEGERIICDLCPHRCSLKKGQKGLCGVRIHRGEAGLFSLNYGLVSSMALDPVEKKPLYHWNPGTEIFSIGSIGCNMHCPFCQNWEISTCSSKVPLTYIPSSDLLRLVRKEQVRSVAFTYNEPLIWYEYVMDTAQILKKEGIPVVLVSNGMINEAPLKDLLPYVDAANIDVKAFDEETYRFMGGNLNTVKQTVETMITAGIHVELTSLIVTGIHKDTLWIESLAKWAAFLSPSMVLHISRYFPCYKWNEKPTPITMLREAKSRAEKHLHFVYLGNVTETVFTLCPSCKATILERRGYNTYIQAMDREGRCAKCGFPIVTLTGNED